MARMRHLTPALVLPTVLLALAGCASSPSGTAASSSAEGEIAWSSCAELVQDVEELADLTGTASVLSGWEDRMQCGEVSVPLDYADPGGRQVVLAVSRLLPARSSAGIVLTNPGGPGVEGRTMPALLAGSAMADLAQDRTVVGIDVRGAGGSTSVECESLLALEAPEGEVDEQVALAYASDVATANEECVASDPAYFAQMTVQNAARDLDRVRDALGVEQVDYLGVSWGTELGVAYLTAFPERVGRMVLDSVTDLRQDAPSSLDDVAEALAGTTSERAGSDGLALAGSYRPLAWTTRTAMTCNAYTGVAAPAQTWSEHLARAERWGLDPQERTGHPLSADLPGTSACAGWPLEPRPLEVVASAHDGLQIVVHAEESVTPAVWGVRAHDLLGGHLAILDDAWHGSLAASEAAAAAVDFLRSGTPMP
jgi:pimeloyl-ACP methyl ester carboxylesterase